MKNTPVYYTQINKKYNEFTGQYMNKCLQMNIELTTYIIYKEKLINDDMIITEH